MSNNNSNPSNDNGQSSDFPDLITADHFPTVGYIRYIDESNLRLLALIDIVMWHKKSDYQYARQYLKNLRIIFKRNGSTTSQLFFRRSARATNGGFQKTDFIKQEDLQVFLNAIPVKLHDYKAEFKQILEDKTIEWRPIVGYESLYEISNTGYVKRLAGTFKCKKDRILILHYDGHGYYRVILCKNGNKKNAWIHQLVARAFIGERTAAHINHKNGQKTDNRPENLEYVTASQNYQHAIDNGLRTYKYGESFHSSKLTDDGVRQIRVYLSQGLSNKKISKLMGIGQTTVSNVRTGLRWKHVK